LWAISEDMRYIIKIIEGRGKANEGQKIFEGHSRINNNPNHRYKKVRKYQSE
jgi:hypothetical protein